MGSGSPADGASTGGLAPRIRAVPDYPKPGVLFRDITPLLGDPRAFREALDAMAAPFESSRVEAVASIESRGFFFGAPLALRFGAGLVPLRKTGKLPAATVSESYVLEYGEEALEMHADALGPGRRVLVVDDVLATGGTAAAAYRLLRRQRAEVIGFSFLAALSCLAGKPRLASLGPAVHAVLELP